MTEVLLDKLLIDNVLLIIDWLCVYVLEVGDGEVEQNFQLQRESRQKIPQCFACDR